MSSKEARHIYSQLGKQEMAAVQTIVEFERRNLSRAKVLRYKEDLGAIVRQASRGRLRRPPASSAESVRGTTVAFRAVEIEDFGPFAGSSRLEFPRSGESERTVSLVLAENGAGKTSFSDALQWALYGGTPARAHPIVHGASGDGGAGAHARVAVEFVTPDGAEYRAVRVATMLGDGTEEFREDAEVYLRQGSEWHKRDEKAETILGQIFPPALRRYIFTTGEALSHVNDEGERGQLTEALHHVLGLKLLERAKDHLKDVELQLQREVKNLVTPAAQKQEELLEKLQSEQEQQIAQAKTIEEEVDTARQVVARIEEELKNFSSATARQSLREQLARDVALAEGEIAASEKRVRGVLNDTAMGLVFEAHLREQIEEILAELEREDRLPPPIQRTVLTDLLAASRCLCGRGLSRELDASAVSALEAMITKAAAPGIDGGYGTLQGFLKATKRSAERIMVDGQLNEARRQISSWEARLQDAEAQIQGISVDLSSDPRAEVAALENRRAACRADIESRIERLATMRTNRNFADAKIEELKTELKRAAASREESLEVGAAYECAGKIGGFFRTLYELRRRESRERVNELLRRYPFGPKRLVGEVTEEFRLRTVRLGRDNLVQGSEPAPSTGETLATALALIRVLSDLQAEESSTDELSLDVMNFPTVLDAPTAPLGGTMIEAICQWVREVMKQPIILMNDEHWEGAYESLASSVGACAVIELHSPTAGRTVRLPDGRSVPFVVNDQDKGAERVYSQIVTHKIGGAM